MKKVDCNSTVIVILIMFNFYRNYTALLYTHNKYAYDEIRLICVKLLSFNIID